MSTNKSCKIRTTVSRVYSTMNNQNSGATPYTSMGLAAADNSRMAADLQSYPVGANNQNNGTLPEGHGLQTVNDIQDVNTKEDDTLQGESSDNDMASLFGDDDSASLFGDDIQDVNMEVASTLQGESSDNNSLSEEAATCSTPPTEAATPPARVLTREERWQRLQQVGDREREEQAKRERRRARWARRARQQQRDEIYSRGLARSAQLATAAEESEESDADDDDAAARRRDCRNEAMRKRREEARQWLAKFPVQEPLPESDDEISESEDEMSDSDEEEEEEENLVVMDTDLWDTEEAENVESRAAETASQDELRSGAILEEEGSDDDDGAQATLDAMPLEQDKEVSATSEDELMSDAVEEEADDSAENAETLAQIMAMLSQSDEEDEATMLSQLDEEDEATLQETTSPVPTAAQAGPSKRKATEEIEEGGASSSRKKQKPLSASTTRANMDRLWGAADQTEEEKEKARVATQKAEQKAAVKVMKAAEKAAAKAEDKAKKAEEKAAAKLEAKSKKAAEKAAAKENATEEQRAAKEQRAAEAASVRAAKLKVIREDAKKAQKALDEKNAAEEKQRRRDDAVLAAKDWKLVKEDRNLAKLKKWDEVARKDKEQAMAKRVKDRRDATLLQVASGNVQQMVLDDDDDDDDVVGSAGPESFGSSREDAICID